MKFQYHIYVNGIPAVSAPTFKSALVKITEKFHNKLDITVKKDNVIVWKAN